MEIIKFIEVNKKKIASVINDTENRSIVIFCHGFRSTKIGPNRFFVKVARELEKQNISFARSKHGWCSGFGGCFTFGK
jgi:hypothetical protein